MTLFRQIKIVCARFAFVNLIQIFYLYFRITHLCESINSSKINLIGCLSQHHFNQCVTFFSVVYLHMSYLSLGFGDDDLVANRKYIVLIKQIYSTYKEAKEYYNESFSLFNFQNYTLTQIESNKNKMLPIILIVRFEVTTVLISRIRYSFYMLNIWPSPHHSYGRQNSISSNEYVLRSLLKRAQSQTTRNVYIFIRYKRRKFILPNMIVRRLI